MCCDLRDLSASTGRCKLRLMRSCLRVLMKHVGKEKQALQQLTAHALLFTTQDFTHVEAFQANWVDRPPVTSNRSST